MYTYIYIYTHARIYICIYIYVCVCVCRKGKDATNDVDKVFKYLCSMENDIIRSRIITIRGRNVTFRKTCGRVLDTTFEELCDRVRHLPFVLCYMNNRNTYDIIINI